MLSINRTMNKIALILICTAALGACAKKKAKSSNTTPTKITEAQCATKPGYQWTNDECVMSTAENNQIMCESAGRRWENNVCLAAGSTPTTTTTTTTAVAACSDLISISGSISCLDSRTNELDTNLRSKPTGLNWVSGALGDMDVIRKNYSQLRSKNINDNSNFVDKVSGCSDISVMGVQYMQLNLKILTVKNTPEAASLTPILNNFKEALGASRKAVCGF